MRRSALRPQAAQITGALRLLALGLKGGYLRRRCSAENK
jgi:hypothetical protein